MRVLDKIDKPSDLKLIRPELLPQLVEELRSEIIRTVSKTGGHLASSLGTVELIVAMHYVFNAPSDRIIFDVGHQSYSHKLLTGRRDRFGTLRQYGGISGFPSRSESEYDCYGSGHSSTALSAGVGFAVARDMKRQDNKVIVVLGDGSITGGMSFEGLNNAGHLGTDILVILNDNEMFISYRVGAVAAFLTKILTLGLVKKVERQIETTLRRMHFTGLYILRIAKRFKLLLFPGMLFEEMGFAYFGPINGHNLQGLVNILGKVKKLKGPIVLHVITKKGKGYEPAEQNPIQFHGVAGFEVETGNREKDKSKPTFTEIFSSALTDLAMRDDRVVAVTAAMPQGTGLEEFSRQFPDRFFDVGIAEQHALTFSAALAAEGFKPVCAVYSTFLQRGFDQLVHDIALQKLHVIVAIDRSGIVGHDGSTHQGTFDVSYLRLIPGFVIMAPKDGDELADMLYSALRMDCPVAIRYPRAHTEPRKNPGDYNFIEKGKAQVLAEGKHLYMLALGDTVNECMRARELLSKEGVSCGVVNARFAKPLDRELIQSLLEKTGNIVTVEENVLAGGFGSAVLEEFAGAPGAPGARDVPPGGPRNALPPRIHCIGLPDSFIEHGSRDILKSVNGMDAKAIATEVLEWLKEDGGVHGKPPMRGVARDA